ncbi:C4-dicarboxylate ABC transporter, partial [Acinetobacter baumannii]
LGQQAQRVAPSVGFHQFANVFQALGVVGSLVLLGFGLWWLGLAILTTLRHAKTGIPFNLGWWGLTFPLGVFILALFNLGHQVEIV